MNNYAIMRAMEYETLLLDNPFGAPVFHVAQTDSTMRLARELSAAGYPDGTVIRAAYQSAGRGRIDGRTWEAAAGENLLCTTLLRRPPVRGFTLRVGLAVAKTFNRYLPAGEKARIKWPNDVLVRGKKVSGILCEADGGTLYVGTGFNLAQRRFPPEISHKAGSLASLFPDRETPDQDRFLEAYLGELHGALGLEDWHDRVSELLLYRGERVRFLQGDPGKGEWIDGTVEGIGPDGELLFKPETADAPACCATVLRLFSGEIPYPDAAT